MIGFMVAADRSGSGKTTVTRGLMLLLKSKGYPVIPFKCGPDYIDPMYHELITGVRGHSLDTFFTDREETRRIFARDCQIDGPSESLSKEGQPDIAAVCEGVMGIYDGLTGFLPEGSSYDLSKTLGMPILLCINASGAAGTLIPVISGILSFDREKLIRGIFLNQVSDGFFPKLKEKIEESTGLPVIGHLPKDKELAVSHRHLGLLTPERGKTRDQDALLLERMETRVDLGRLLEIGRMAEVGSERNFSTGRGNFSGGINCLNSDASDRKGLLSTGTDSRVDIAIARDLAFDFFYRENEIALEDMGARIVYFSPLGDVALPEGVSGLILPGGYPEKYVRQLAENKSMVASVRAALESGMPVLAECGGFMYLHETIDGQGPLVGYLPGDCFFTGKSIRFGYLEASDQGHFFLKEGERIRGHEFHYYDVKDPGDGAEVMRIRDGVRGRAGCCDRRRFLSFMHFYYPSAPEFIRYFIMEAAAYGRELQKQL